MTTTNLNLTLWQKILAMGPLRNMLQAVSLVLAALTPFAKLPDYSANWDLFFSGVVPAISPIFFILLMLDVMMSNVWKDGETPERIAQLNFIIRAHLVCAGALLLSFLVVFLPQLTR